MNDQNRRPPVEGRRLLRLSEVRHHVGLGRTAIYDQIKRGDFPAPVRLGARAVAWRSDQISDWIDSRIESARSSPMSRRES